MAALPKKWTRVAVAGWALFWLIPYGSAEDRLQEVTASTFSDTESQKPWRYLLYLPDEYNAETAHEWPLLIWLHGRSLRGTGLARLRKYGPPSFLGKRSDFPFVAVCPQLPDGSWQPDPLNRLLEECLSKYSVDRDRVCLSGVSLGAMGAWSFAAAYPAKFAALVPVCAHGPASAASTLTDLPIWAFHGDADDIVPIGSHRQLIDAINDNGGSARLTVIPGGDHGSVIIPVYRREDLYDWLLKQKRVRKP